MKQKTNNPIVGVSDKEAYIEFVRSLFADQRSLVIGLLLQISVITFVLFDSGVVWFGIFIVSAILAAGLRLWVARSYHRAEEVRTDLDIDSQVSMARYWEDRSLIPSALSAATIGFFGYFGVTYGGSEFALSASLCLLFTPLPTVVGRLYGSRRLAGVMLFGNFAPIIIGYVSSGIFTHVAIGLLCIPYIALVMGMVDNVRATVIGAVRGNSEKVDLGRRFDVALRNMSHGLMMFDDNQCVSIINDQALSLFNIPSKRNLVGRHVLVLMRYARRFDAMSSDNVKVLQSSVLALLDRQSDRVQILFDDGRYIELSASDRSAGGTVISFEDVTERVLSAKKIERMAQFDGLTNLPNRKHFEFLVHDLVKSAKPDEFCALLVIDVDDFKYVNDAVGHAQGDALLRSIAATLVPETGLTHVASRLGGDEFLVFMGGLKSEDQASEVVASLNSRLCGIHDLGAEQIYITCSIGFMTSRTLDFKRDEAIIRADLALYAAKKKSKGAWEQFVQAMDDQYQRRQRIKKQLAKAIQSNSLTVIYQPLVDANTGRLVSCEALSRWYDEEYGRVSPAEYIPLAEEMGIVTQISEQVLRKAALECSKWPDHVSVSVNLSPVDFRSGDILAVIKKALADSGLSPTRLEIEVTETAVISNEREMIEKLREIRSLGVRISLDDFGTGNSSLSYLHRLPLNKVKIDRSFVVGIDTGETPIELLRGITELCSALDLDVTVEGVETESQLKLVVSEGKVDRIQGFIYGPGLPASGIDALANIGRMPLAHDISVAG